MAFIEQNPFPLLDNFEAMKTTNWRKKDLQKEWEKLTTKLYVITYNTIY